MTGHIYSQQEYFNFFQMFIEPSSTPIPFPHTQTTAG